MSTAMLMTLPQPLTQKRLAGIKEDSLFRTPIYFVAWRSGKSHPWRSEEFASRFQAHNRYFGLLDRGAEAYVKKRKPVNS